MSDIKMFCPSCGGDNYRRMGNKLTEYGFKRYICKGSKADPNCRRTFTTNTASKVPMAVPDPEPAQVITDEQRLLNEIKGLKAQVKSLSQEAYDTTQLRKLIHQIDTANVTPPAWLTRKKAPGLLGTPTLFLSDLHWDERVYRNQVNGCNEYNRPIAQKRLKRVFSQAVTLLRDYMVGEYDGFVLPLGGDMLSGNIHEELRETNEGPVLESLLDLFEHLVAGINQLTDEFGRVFVPCVVGNHGRMDRKPRAKGAVKDNYEWILYQFLAKHFGDDDRVTVAVSESLDYIYRVHNTTYLLTHGDQFRGGTGISGPMTPWALGDHRKRKRQDAIRQPYDVMIFGHWHQLFWGGGNFICNGSLKGYDEYAFRSNFPYQAPMQALWVTHPDKGVTFHMPVLADDVENEQSHGWVSLPDVA